MKINEVNTYAIFRKMLFFLYFLLIINVNNLSLNKQNTIKHKFMYGNKNITPLKENSILFRFKSLDNNQEILLNQDQNIENNANQFKEHEFKNKKLNSKNKKVKNQIRDNSIILPSNNNLKISNFTLENGINVLIINDDKANTDGVSMTINCGAEYDRDVLGLAHFTEHMLFLGSKKYSNESYFVDFITQNNGKFNGYTAFDRTGFFFKINPDFLDKALDIFAQFFISPLFNEIYVEKEVNSVNSEYERNCQQDGRKREGVVRLTSKEGSPPYKFRTGSKETLLLYSKENNISLKKRVEEFYVKCYNPDKMKLLIIGSKDIEFYKNLTEKNFGQIKQKNPQDFNLILEEFNNIDWMLPRNQAYDYFKEGKLVLYETINDHKEIDIQFLIPDIIDQLPSNIGLYIKTLINYQGKGSLLFNLRNQGLVSSLKSKVSGLYKGMSAFKISAYITDKGIKNIDKILEIIIQYIDFLKKDSLDENLYKNIKDTYDKEYFKKRPLKSSMMANLKKLSSSFSDFPMKYIFSQLKIVDEYNSKNILSFLEFLKISNSIITIGNNSFTLEDLNYLNNIVDNYDNNVIFDQEEKFLKTKFRIYRINSNIINKIDNHELIVEGNTFKINFSEPKEMIEPDDGEEDINLDDHENKEVSQKNNKKFETLKHNKGNEIVYDYKLCKNENNKIGLMTHIKGNIKRKYIKPRKITSGIRKNKDIKSENNISSTSSIKENKKKRKNIHLKKKGKKFTKKVKTMNICEKNLKKDEMDLTPIILKNDNKSIIFLKQDRSFFTSKANVVVKIVNPSYSGNIRNNTIMRLLVYAINIKIRDIFNNKHLGPNEITLKVDSNGFTIRINSFNKSIKEVLVLFFNGIKKIKISENEFHVIKEEMQKQFDGTINIIPKLKAIVNFFSIVLKSYIPGKEILKELRGIENDSKGAETVNEYFKLLDNSYLYFFYHGDISIKEALDASLEVEKQMFTQVESNHSNNLNENIGKNYLKLNPHFEFNGRFIFRELQGNDFNYDHATVNFYKIGENNIKNLFLTHIFSNIIGYIYFTELRIKQQLGYTTSGKAFSEGDNLYFMIFVQGSRVEPDKVDGKIDELIPLMRQRLSQANDKSFKKALSTSIMKLKLKDKTLTKRTDRLNNIILKNLNMIENISEVKDLDRSSFNQIDEAKKLQKSVTKQDVLDFFDKIFLKNVKKISIQEYSNKVKNLPYQNNETNSNLNPVIIDSSDYFRLLDKNIGMSSEA